MKILDVLYFMPALVCLLWVITFMMSEKTHRQKMMMLCLIVAVPYLISYGLWALPDTDYQVYAQVEQFSRPLAIILLAMIAIYMNLHVTGSKVKIIHSLLLAPGLMYGTTLNTLYYIIGTESIAQYYSLIESEAALPEQFGTRLFDTFVFFSRELTMYLGGAFLFFVIVECIYVFYKGGYHFGDLCRFFLKKRKTTPSRMVALCMILILLLVAPIIIFPTWMPDHPAVGVTLAMGLAIMLHMMCFTEFHSNMVAMNSSSLIDSLKANRIVATSDEEAILEKIMAEEEELSQETRGGETRDGETRGDETQDSSISAESNEIEELDDDLNIDSIRVKRAASIFNAFTKLMVEDKIYLDSDLTIGEVAERLLIGRSTLSNMINHEYGKTFRSVLNDYRIYYAKQYMLDNPGSTQEMIAMKCGFKDASAFSHKFKDIVGISPLMWLTSQTKKNRNSGV